MSIKKSELPSKLKEPFEIVSDEFTFVLHVLKQYRQLFGHSEERIAILNGIAPSFFQLVQISLMDSVILGATKLLDPAKNGSNKNASLEWLEEIISQNGDDHFAKELQCLRLELKELVGSLRKNRHKRIAHSDRIHAKKKKLYPFPISRKEIREVYKRIHVYLNKINEFYTDTSIRFDVTDIGDAESVLYSIVKSLRYDELIENGSIDRLDKLNNKWIKALGQNLQTLDDTEEWEKY